MDLPFSKQRLLTAVCSILGLAFLFVLYRTAWLSDDAYITYRSIDNFVNGYGMTFNPGQRVQAYTHPLWAFLHIPFQLLFENMYGIGLFISISVSIASVLVLLWKLTRELEIRIFLLLAIIFSAAFIDFCTSGLENPLTHLLLALFVWIYLDERSYSHRLFMLAFIAGLILLNRMDSILLVAPVLLVVCWRKRSWRTLGIVLVGMLPFILWEWVAIIYYGFPFPMTAYAKLNISMGRGALLVQGMWYFLDILKEDPVSPFIIIGGITAPFMSKNKDLYPFSAGILLYILYVWFIGGDFMRGRFFTAPFFLSLGIWAKVLSTHRIWYVSSVVVALGFFASAPPLIVSRNFAADETKKASFSQTHGIANERAYYFQGAGLIHASGQKLPANAWVERGKEFKNSSRKHLLSGNMGFVGYYAGPEKHIIDRYALTDPFLAQLPNVYQPDWRPGHNRRLIPRGYLNSLTSGKNEMLTPELKEVYDAIQIITRAPIWSAERFRTIWKMNASSYYADLIDQEKYYLPIAVSIKESDLPTFKSQTILAHTDAGLEIRLAPKRKLQQLALQIQSDCEFICAMADEEEIISGKILIKTSESQRLRGLNVPLPEEEIDRIVIFPNTPLQGCQLKDITIR